MTKPPFLPPIPPPEPQLDRFGLPVLPTLLGMLGANDDVRAKIQELAQDLFASAKVHLGEKDAHELFKQVSSKARGRPKNTKNFEYNKMLIAAYDDALPQIDESIRPSLPRLVAAHVTKQLRSTGTPEAAEKQLRKLLKERDDRKKQDAVMARARRMFLRRHGIDTGPSLLGSLLALSEEGE